MAKLFKEPLFRFFVLGLGLFVLYHFIAGTPKSASDQDILISDGQIRHMESLFLKVRHRPPSSEELKGLVDDYILEEVFYREAKAMGLDENDTIIRRRLRQKMDFLIDDYAAKKPSEKDLESFFALNSERYRTENQVSFEHLYFKDEHQQKARKTAKSLRQNPSVKTTHLGEPFSLPKQFDLLYEKDISSMFGGVFKDDLLKAEVADWTGPIKSPYGWHIVKIHKKIESRLPHLDEVREQVERDWAFEKRKLNKQKQIEAMLAKYRVQVESTKVARK